MIIKINKYLSIKLHNGVYHLVDRTTELPIEATFELEHMAEKVIQYHTCYLSDKDVINIEKLIQQIREVKETISGIC